MKCLLKHTVDRILLDEKIVQKIKDAKEKCDQCRLELYFKFGALSMLLTFNLKRHGGFALRLFYAYMCQFLIKIT